MKLKVQMVSTKAAGGSLKAAMNWVIRG